MRQRFSPPTGSVEASRAALRAALAELEQLDQQLQDFESLVDTRLGSLLDQLSALSADTQALSDELQLIRERHLFGDNRMSYLDGAPRPARPGSLNSLPPLILDLGSAGAETKQLPEIKALYRKLARRYHPDLARDDLDRASCTQTMVEINQAYAAGDMPALLRLAGMGLPYGASLAQPLVKPSPSEIEAMPGQAIAAHLENVRKEIERLSRLPLVKLSLEVKLARQNNRDLLHELSDELRYKVERKTAERDYLRAQVRVSNASTPSSSAE